MLPASTFLRKRLYRPIEGSTSRINDRNYQSQILHGRFNNASDPLSENSKNSSCPFRLPQKDLFRLDACIDFNLKRDLVCSDLDRARFVLDR